MFRRDSQKMAPSAGRSRRIQLVVVFVLVMVVTLEAIVSKDPCPPFCRCYTVRMINPWGRVDCRNINIEQYPDIQGRIHVLFGANNPITSLIQRTFVNASELGYVFIDYNPISYIEDNTFSTLGKLQILALTNCGLVNISSIRDIDGLNMLRLSGNRLANFTNDDIPGIPYLENLDLDRNQIDHFQFSHPYIKYLNLSQNLLDHFHRGMFEGLQSLHTLDVSNNLIVHLDGLYSACLTKLFLAGNEIQSIVSSLWQNLPILDEIDLSHNHLRSVSNITNVLRLKYLDLSYNSIPDVGNLTGLVDLTFLDLSNNSLNIVHNWPEFPELRVLNLSGNCIEDINEKFLENNPELETLHVDGNRLSSLPAFINVASLHVFTLANNMIVDIDPRAFDGASALMKIDFSRNRISDLEVFKNLPAATHIDLSNNNVSVVHKDAFKGCPRMSFIDLSHNSIEAISTFPVMPCLTQLLLDYNPIKVLEWVKFSNLARLTKLSMNDTKITYLPRISGLNTLLEFSMQNVEIQGVDNMAFSLSSMLQVLCLDNAGLNAFPSIGSLYLLGKIFMKSNNISHVSFKEIKYLGLEELQVTNNVITKLEVGARSLPRLSILRAENNLIRNISFVKYLTSLRTLILTNNKISFIPKDAFGGNLALRTVDLGSNLIERMPVGVFDATRYLYHIVLSNNKLTNFTLAFAAWTPDTIESRKRIGKLDLDGNCLSYVGPELFNSTRSIRYLNLAGNPIEIITPDAFRDLIVLWQLNISNTPVEDIPSTVFQSSSLKYLYMNNVTFMKNMEIAKKPFPSLYEVARIIEIKENGLTTLPNMTGASVLQLIASNNKLSDDFCVRLNSINNIVQLDVSQNNISTLKAGCLKKQIVLKTVNVSGNGLRQIESSAFDNVHQLQTVDFTSNKLETVPGDMVSNLHLGSKINISGNPIKCGCNMKPAHVWMNRGAKYSRDRVTNAAITCSTPTRLVAKRFLNLTGQELQCAPVKRIGYTHMIGYIGQTTKMVCPVKDATGVVVKWETPWNLSGPNHRVDYSLAEDGSLQINNTTRQCAGVYTCTATNQEGSATIEVTLAVSEVPDETTTAMIQTSKASGGSNLLSRHGELVGEKDREDGKIRLPSLNHCTRFHGNAFLLSFLLAMTFCATRVKVHRPVIP